MTEEIYRRRQLQAEAADRACEAAHELARVANSGMITGPAAYDILGNLKMLLYHLTEVTKHIPEGLGESLSDRTITVTDRGTWGDSRDPHQQVAAATLHLDVITISLEQAIRHAEGAQVALNGQGFEAHPTTCPSRHRHADTIDAVPTPPPPR